MTALHKFLRRWLVAVTAATLCFAGYIGSLSEERQRFFRYWDRSDAIVILLDILILSLPAAVLSLALDRVPLRGVRKAYQHASLLLLGIICMALIPQATWDRHPTLGAFVLPLIFAVVGFSLGRPNSRLPIYAANVCFVLSLLPPLLLVPMFFWAPWNSPLAPLPAKGEQGVQGKPVFFFVFDEWSYTRSTEGNQFLRSLPNLHALAEQSYSFRRATSPGAMTYASLPMTLYQSDQLKQLPNVFVKDGEGERLTNGQAGADKDRRSGAAGQGCATLLEMARAYDYLTYVLGFYLPYGRMLRGNVDACRAYSYYPKGDNLGERLLLTALETLRYGKDPLSNRLFRPLYTKEFCRHWLALHSAMRQDLFTLIENAAPRSFCFIHFPLPHGPFIFEADGTRRADCIVDFVKSHNIDDDLLLATPEEYMRNVYYLDVLVGEIVTRLKAAGKFADALIIMTSDHSWRGEADARYLDGPKAVFHVPLIVKLPGQNVGQGVDSPVEISHLRPCIERILQKGADAKHSAEFLPSSGTLP